MDDIIKQIINKTPNGLVKFSFIKYINEGKKEEIIKYIKEQYIGGAEKSITNLLGEELINKVINI